MNAKPMSDSCPEVEMLDRVEMLNRAELLYRVNIDISDT